MGRKRWGPRPLDSRKLLEDCDDEPAFANRCLHTFVRETQKDIRGIAAALDSGDLPVVSRLAHRIKGASASIRAEFLCRHAAMLEHLGSQGESTAAGECFALLRTEFHHFRNFVANLKIAAE